MFTTNRMVLRWTLDSVLLPVVVMSKGIVKALQWRSKRWTQVQSYINQTELTSELNVQCNYIALVERHFHSNNN